MPEPARFLAEHVHGARPAIFTDLFAGEALRGLGDEDAVRRSLGDMAISLKEEFTTNVLRNGLRLDRNPPRPSTVADYLDAIRRDPSTRMMCTEMVTPEPVRALFSPPAQAAGLGDPDDTLSLLFLGNSGNFASLHFDGDYRHVLLYQVFGEKRVVLVPPWATARLHPVLNFSTVQLGALALDELLGFVRYVGGWTGVLRAGEALFFPACWWHYLGYDTTAMSVSWRFGRNAERRFLAKRCHMSPVMLRLADLLDDRPEQDPGIGSWFDAIRSEHAKLHPNALAKARALDAVAMAALRELRPEESTTAALVELPEGAVAAAFAAEAMRAYPNVSAFASGFSGWERLG